MNWWQQIRYDLKTIVSTGWHHTLIPDEYLVAEFFTAEADEIEALEATISEGQSELAEAVEAASEVAGYEPDENEKVTASVMKKALKALIDDLKGSEGESAKRELTALRAQEKAIKGIEKQISEGKKGLKVKGDELELKLQLKRVGGEEFKAESAELLRQNEVALAGLDEKTKADKKKITALRKDQAVIEARVARVDDLMVEMGGVLADADARRLILKKLYDIVHSELNRYLNAEKRELIGAVENLWEKYAVSSRELEKDRAKTLTTLESFLSGLGYV